MPRARPGHRNSSTSHLPIPPSRRKPIHPVQSGGDAAHPTKAPVEVDPSANGSGLSKTSFLLARVWAGRADERWRED